MYRDKSTILVKESIKSCKIGDQFGRVSVVGEPFYCNTYDKITKWKKSDQHCVCQCSCVLKSFIVVKCQNLKRGMVHSCGCLPKDLAKERNTDLFKTHGDSRPKKGNHYYLYSAWKGMHRRCYNTTSNKLYHRYGGRGIKVCEEWFDYDIFKKWALENGAKKGLSLDRIDVDGDYEPSNCEWVTREENSRRQTANRDRKIQELQEENLRLKECIKMIVDKYDINIDDLVGANKDAPSQADLNKIPVE